MRSGSPARQGISFQRGSWAKPGSAQAGVVILALDGPEAALHSFSLEEGGRKVRILDSGACRDQRAGLGISLLDPDQGPGLLLHRPIFR